MKKQILKSIIGITLILYIFDMIAQESFTVNLYPLIGGIIIGTLNGIQVHYRKEREKESIKTRIDYKNRIIDWIKNGKSYTLKYETDPEFDLLNSILKEIENERNK